LQESCQRGNRGVGGVGIVVAIAISAPKRTGR